MPSFQYQLTQILLKHNIPFPSVEVKHPNDIALVEKTEAIATFDHPEKGIQIIKSDLWENPFDAKEDVYYKIILSYYPECVVGRLTFARPYQPNNTFMDKDNLVFGIQPNTEIFGYVKIIIQINPSSCQAFYFNKQLMLFPMELEDLGERIILTRKDCYCRNNFELTELQRNRILTSISIGENLNQLLHNVYGPRKFVQEQEYGLKVHGCNGYIGLDNKISMRISKQATLPMLGLLWFVTEDAYQIVFKEYVPEHSLNQPVFKK